MVARARTGRRAACRSHRGGDGDLLRGQSYRSTPVGIRLRQMPGVRSAPTRLRGIQGGMTYLVKEIYYTLQGEGARTGRAAVFLRFAGCNLWSGLEKDRGRAVCKFCDTDFVGVDGVNGGRFATAEALASAVGALWPKVQKSKQYVVCTGGEPLLQLDSALIDAFHLRHFEVGIESNGTIEAPHGIDWICISPKGEAEVVQRRGNE